MQLVIDICESAYKEMCEYGTDRVDYDIQNMIKNGTVLPKHGRLIDSTETRFAFRRWADNPNDDRCVDDVIDGIPTIL